MNRPSSVAGFLVCATCAAACASARPQPVDFGETAKNYRSEDYATVHDAWTRHGKAIQDIGTLIEIWATYKSPDFRQAYVAKYAKVYDLSDTEREELEKAQKEAARTVYEIHLIVQSTTDRWVDLDRRTSPWRITLLDGTGAELGPSSVKIQKFPEIYESEFFPNRTPFSRTYSLKFTRAEAESFLGAQSGRIALRIASPVGKVEVAWEAKDGAATP